MLTDQTAEPPSRGFAVLSREVTSVAKFSSINLSVIEPTLKQDAFFCNAEYTVMIIIPQMLT